MSSDDYEGYSSLLASAHACHTKNLFVDDITLDYITKTHNLHIIGLTYENETFQSFYHRQEKYYRDNTSEELCKHVASNYNDFYQEKTTEYQNKIYNRAVIRERESKRFTMILSSIAEGLNSSQAFKTPIQTQSIQVAPPIITKPNNDFNINILPAPEGYEKTVVPNATVGILRNSSISNGVKLCEYSNGRATRMQISQTCPNLLTP